MITTIAGATPAGGVPVRGFSGDGGPASSATLSLANVQNGCGDPAQYEQASHVFVDNAGNVYIADGENQRIRRITPAGVITTVAGNGQRPDVNTRCEAQGGAPAAGDNGTATSARLFNPADMLVMPNGNLVIADQQNNRIRQVTPLGVITTIGGNDRHNLYAPGIPATSTSLDWPSALAVDANGVLYFAEIHSNRIARMDPRTSFLTTVAGTGFPGFGGDNGSATAAMLRNPSGIALDAAGNLYIADMLNHRIRKVTPAGQITTIAGNGTAGFSGDGGPATSAALNQPADVKVDARGNLYIADMLNHRVRRVDAVGIITTIAGDGIRGRGPDGVAGTASSLNSPSGLSLDAAGDLYIVDWQNYLVRKLSFSAQPTITPGAVVNAASFAPYPIPLAPGSLVTINGVNLAGGTEIASVVPWPTTLAGASVTVNGAPLPLYYASPSQITAQLPYDLPNGETTAVVTTNAGASKPEPFNVAPAAVGIFQYPGSTRAIVSNQDGSLNGPDNAEARGNVIVAYLTGQGAVMPPVPAGQATPTDQLVRAALPVAAQIGNMDASVLFLGLAPGLVGLAQANIIIPADAPTGNSVLLVISVGGQLSNTTNISVR